MIYYLGALGLLIGFFSPPAFAEGCVRGFNTTAVDDRWIIKDDQWLGNLHTKINYDQEKLVIAASFINNEKAGNDQFYGGTFSPTAAAYFKPFRNSRAKLYVQASCIDYYCDFLMVSIGIRTSVGNPYAYTEPKFVLSRLKMPKL